MEIKSNIKGMESAIIRQASQMTRLTAIKEELVYILTDIDDYWVGRSGDSFRYVCWYMKLLLDRGVDDFDALGDEIIEAKDAFISGDNRLAKQIENHG